MTHFTHCPAMTGMSGMSGVVGQVRKEDMNKKDRIEIIRRHVNYMKGLIDGLASSPTDHKTFLDTTNAAKETLL